MYTVTLIRTHFEINNCFTCQLKYHNGDAIGSGAIAAKDRITRCKSSLRHDAYIAYYFNKIIKFLHFSFLYDAKFV